MHPPGRGRTEPSQELLPICLLKPRHRMAVAERSWLPRTMTLRPLSCAVRCRMRSAGARAKSPRCTTRSWGLTAAFHRPISLAYISSTLENGRAQYSMIRAWAKWWSAVTRIAPTRSHYATLHPRAHVPVRTPGRVRCACGASRIGHRRLRVVVAGLFRAVVRFGGSRVGAMADDPSARGSNLRASGVGSGFWRSVEVAKSML